MTLNYAPVFPRERKVPIGCIGAGFIMTDCHLVAYRASGFNPVAIADLSAERREAAAARHKILKVYDSASALMNDPEIQVIDIGVPPDIQLSIVREAIKHKDHIRGILAHKPLGADFAQAAEIVRLCRQAGIVLAVNQNMRYDQSARACHDLLTRGILGEPVLATIEMRAIPHWMPWQERQGWCTLRIMSIHHLDTFRFWFGDPDRIYASVRPDRERSSPTLTAFAFMSWNTTNPAFAPQPGMMSGPGRPGKAPETISISTGGSRVPKVWPGGLSVGRSIRRTPRALSIFPLSRIKASGMSHAGRRSGFRTLLQALWPSFSWLLRQAGNHHSPGRTTSIPWP